jgi:hypothetical protein
MLFLHRLRTTLLPEHCSSPISTNRMDDPYWLASRSSVQPITASPPTNFLLQEHI